MKGRRLYKIFVAGVLAISIAISVPLFKEHREGLQRELWLKRIVATAFYGQEMGMLNMTIGMVKMTLSQLYKRCNDPSQNNQEFMRCESLTNEGEMHLIKLMGQKRLADQLYYDFMKDHQPLQSLIPPFKRDWVPSEQVKKELKEMIMKKMLQNRRKTLKELKEYRDV